MFYTEILNFRGHFREHFRERVRGSDFAVRVLCAFLTRVSDSSVAVTVCLVITSEIIEVGRQSFLNEWSSGRPQASDEKQ